jgi:hypothetical protein
VKTLIGMAGIAESRGSRSLTESRSVTKPNVGADAIDAFFATAIGLKPEAPSWTLFSICKRRNRSRVRSNFQDLQGTSWLCNPQPAVSNRQRPILSKWPVTAVAPCGGQYERGAMAAVKTESPVPMLEKFLGEAYVD